MQHIDWDILRRALLGEISDEESVLLDSWLDASPDNKAYFDQFKQYYSKSKESKIDFDKNHKIFKEKLEAKNVKVIKPKFNKLMQIAASIVIVLGISLTFLYYNPIIIRDNNIIALLEPSEIHSVTLVSENGESYDLSQKEELVAVSKDENIQLDENLANYSKPVDKKKSIVKKIEFHTLIVPVGMKYNILLPDGSKVYLNSDTEFRYPTEFAAEFPRKVYVKGEAYFEVKHNKKSPFIVVADNIEVRNYGTAYNVNNRNSERIITTLVDGSISITDTEAKANEFFVKPNQQAVFVEEERKVKISNVNVNQYLGWKNGLFIFENESLENIINELYLEYNIAFSTTDKEKLNQRFTSYIPRYNNFEEVLKIIESTGKVRFNVEGEKVTIE